ncbi:hypothetical protein AAE478_008806 [Parahypoxylon ruwenzoriense]
MARRTENAVVGAEGFRRSLTSFRGPYVEKPVAPNTTPYPTRNPPNPKEFIENNALSPRAYRLSMQVNHSRRCKREPRLNSVASEPRLRHLGESTQQEYRLEESQSEITFASPIDLE